MFRPIYRAARYALCLVLTLAASAQAATYHVDAADGNDSNDGLSQQKAWKTLGKVSQSRLEPGDDILLKRGQPLRRGRPVYRQAPGVAAHRREMVTMDPVDLARADGLKQAISAALP